MNRVIYLSGETASNMCQLTGGVKALEFVTKALRLRSQLPLSGRDTESRRKNGKRARNSYPSSANCTEML